MFLSWKGSFWISQTPQRNIAIAAGYVEWVSAKYVKNSLAILGDFYGLQVLLTTGDYKTILEYFWVQHSLLKHRFLKHQLSQMQLENKGIIRLT